MTSKASEVAFVVTHQVTGWDASLTFWLCICERWASNACLPCPAPLVIMVVVSHGQGRGFGLALAGEGPRRVLPVPQRGPVAELHQHLPVGLEVACGEARWRREKPQEGSTWSWCWTGGEGAAAPGQLLKQQVLLCPPSPFAEPRRA